jgi:hypothetical protein
VLVLVTQLCAEKCLIGRAHGIQRPEGTKRHDPVGLFHEQPAQLFFGGVDALTALSARDEFDSSLTGEPFIGVRVQLDELPGVEFCNVPHIAALRLTVGDLVNAPARAVDSGALVTFTRVAPVQDEHSAVGAVTEVHAAEPGIACEETILPVMAHIAGTVAFKDLLIRAEPMQVQSEQVTAVFGWPIVPQINHHPDVRMAAAESVRLFGSRF